MTMCFDRYSFKRTYSFDDKTKTVSHVNSPLHVYKNNRYYNTKKKVEDLPEHYCVVHRGYGNYDVIPTVGVKDLNYKWVKENHFMKDSVLQVSFGDKIEEFEVFTTTIDGNCVKSLLKDYRNVDEIVFGNEIFKFLGYVKKYSGFDLSEIKKEFIKQCEWLKENEPTFAPDTNDFGTWFDNTIEEAKLWQA